MLSFDIHQKAIDKFGIYLQNKAPDYIIIIPPKSSKSMKAKVLLVDDDLQLSPMTKEYLEAKGLHVDLVHSGDAGLRTFMNGVFDLCVLDIRMPFKDGYTLASEIRDIAPDIPIVFLTGLHDKEDKIKGLTIGADDYITKPFSMEELSLRIHNILRRSSFGTNRKMEQSKLTVGLYTIDAVSRELLGPQGIVKLTSIEAQLLSMLFQHVNDVLGRETALRKIWGDEHQLHGRSLNVYISKLRQFLKADPNIEILNVHGVGYKLVVR